MASLFKCCQHWQLVNCVLLHSHFLVSGPIVLSPKLPSLRLSIKVTDTGTKWHSHKFLIMPIATGIFCDRGGEENCFNRKARETNLHEIKSMKEHFCGEMISLQVHCQSLRTVLWSQPCGHFLWPPVSIILQETSHGDVLTGMPEKLINGGQRWGGR